jgi:hypothetical protein
MTPTMVLGETSLATAQENVRANSAGMVSRLNADLAARYNQAYADYVTNMQSGGFVPEERRTPPKPPMGWELAPANEDGFVFYQIGTTPVCAQGSAVGYQAAKSRAEYPAEHDHDRRAERQQQVVHGAEGRHLPERG